jgi:hypothetical protein
MTQANACLARHPQTRLQFPHLQSRPSPRATFPRPCRARARLLAIHRLTGAHTKLVTAQAAEEEAAAMFDDSLAQHTGPKSKRGPRRWVKQWEPTNAKSFLHTG